LKLLPGEVFVFAFAFIFLKIDDPGSGDSFDMPFTCFVTEFNDIACDSSIVNNI
jgi:hypothetical protein